MGPILLHPTGGIGDRPRDGGQAQAQASAVRLITVMRQVKMGIPSAGQSQDQAQ